jgi:hypothetical protein
VIAREQDYPILIYYSTPRTPTSELEEVFSYPDDDPFYTEFENLIHVVNNKNKSNDDRNEASESQILSTYLDACKTYDFTWRIRDESERSSERLLHRRAE